SSRVALAGKKTEIEQSRWQFSALVKASYQLAQAGTPLETSRDIFLTAQWAISSEAARSLTQMAARGSKGDPALAVLVRERQDLVMEWLKRDGLQNTWLGQSPDKRDSEAEGKNQVRLATINTRIGEIDGALKERFPDYEALASPAPSSVEEVQAQLHNNEALMLFFDTQESKPTPEETFIWVVTKTEVHWVRSELGTSALTREVAALRCGLDTEAWYGGGADRCDELLKFVPGRASKGNAALPFDLARANSLYKALFGEAEDLIKGKDLIIVPSGPLTQLPFQVLVTHPPRSGDYKSATWLVRDHAITVLPAVSSLKALRRVARASAAEKPLIGFGNPLLDGDQGHPLYGDYYKKQAALAREKQHCRETTIRDRIASFFGLRGGVTPIAIRGGLANLDQLRMQLPLPETADELCAVARDLKVDASEIRLGSQAT